MIGCFFRLPDFKYRGHPNYGYYTTVDFPYVFQCYRGEIGNTSPSIRDGNCGLYGTNCDYSASGGAGAGARPGERNPTTGERPRECCRTKSCGSDYTCPPKPNRKKRSTTDPFSNPTQAGSFNPLSHKMAPSAYQPFENPSQHWLETNLNFHGGNGPYFQHKFLSDGSQRNKRSVSALTQARSVN